MNKMTDVVPEAPIENKPSPAIAALDDLFAGNVDYSWFKVQEEDVQPLKDHFLPLMNKILRNYNTAIVKADELGFVVHRKYQSIGIRIKQVETADETNLAGFIYALVVSSREIVRLTGSRASKPSVDTTVDPSKMAATDDKIIVGTEDRLSSLPAESRLLIGGFLELPAPDSLTKPTYELVYPPITGTGPHSLPIAQVSKMIRREASPDLYREVYQVILPRQDYFPSKISHTITSAIPTFARHVKYIRILAIIKTPAISGVSKSRFVFGKEGNSAFIICIMIDPGCAKEKERLMNWMKVRAMGMRTEIVDHLAKDVPVEEKMSLK